MAKILLIFLVVLVFAVPSYGQTIITGGKPVSIITYWSKTEAPVAEFAAKELQKYLAKISGAKIPVQSNHLEDSTPPPPNLTSAVVIAPGPIDPLTLSQILCGID